MAKQARAPPAQLARWNQVGSRLPYSSLVMTGSFLECVHRLGQEVGPGWSPFGAEKGKGSA